MKAFNKLFSLVVASVLVFSLAGCGDKEESKKFSANLNGTEIAITYVYKGDKVLKQSSETKIQFASIGATTKEDAARALEPLSAKYKNIAGVEEKLTYTDTYAQENVTIDMEKWILKPCMVFQESTFLLKMPKRYHYGANGTGDESRWF